MILSFGYDRCGSLTEERRGDNLVRQYAYDSAGQMVMGKNLETGGETAYTYNALGMCVKNVQKPAAADGSRSRQMQYVPDFLSAINNELMAYESDGGSTRTVFGHDYQRLNQGTSAGKTFFQSDIYGSPLFASDGQGALQQYAERDIWGSLKPGTDILPGLKENLRFTSYRYDPVIDKYFARARFYDSKSGRMLAKDPVKRGLNPYRYCDNDPVDYVDPTGEIANILIGGGLGGTFGFAGGFLSSAISQAVSGEKVDWKKALGSGVNGAITGAVQGGLLASGAGIPMALAANFAAGTAGSAAEQYIGTGKVNVRKSVTSGLTNAVSNLIYGTSPLGSAKEAFARGFGAGAAASGINYLSDLFDNRQPVTGSADAGGMSGITRGAVSPYGMQRDPRRGCGSVSPFTPSIGYSSAKGYQYNVPKTESVSQSRKKGFSLKDFAVQTILGGVIGGVASAGFYGAGKGIEKLKESFRAGKGGNSSVARPNQGQGFSSKGYNPQPGERTIEGYVKNNANPEISLTTQSAGFNNSNGNVGGVFKRLGAKSHGGVSPHVHQPQRNIAPDGNVYGSIGSKTSNGGITSPSAKDVKQLYEYLNNGKYQ